MARRLQVGLRITLALGWLCVALAKLLTPANDSWREAGARIGLGEASGQLAFWVVIGGECGIGIGLFVRRSRHTVAWLSLLWAGMAGIARPAAMGHVFRHDCGCLGAFGAGLGRGGVAVVSIGFMFASYIVILGARRWHRPQGRE